MEREERSSFVLAVPIESFREHWNSISAGKLLFVGGKETSESKDKLFGVAGGKLSLNETGHRAAAREFMEETGLEV